MSDDLRLQMMGIGAPAGAPAPAPAPAAGGAGKTADAGYPTLYGLIGDKGKADAFLATAAATKAKLEEASKDAKQKADARKALIAYDHAIGFVKLGAQMVQEQMKAAAAKGGKTKGGKK